MADQRPYTKDARGLVTFHSWYEPSVGELVEIAKTEFPHVVCARVYLRLSGARKDVDSSISLSDLNVEKFYQPGSVIPIAMLEEHTKTAFPNSVIDDVFVSPRLIQKKSGKVHQDKEKMFHFLLYVP